MKKIYQLQICSIILNSLFIGAMLLIACSVVPMWKNMEGSQFLNWFTKYSSNIGSFMIPLSFINLLFFIVIAILMYKKNIKTKFIWIVATLFFLVSVLLFPIYFSHHNSIFFHHKIEISKIPTALDEWEIFHWIRIFFAITALFLQNKGIISEKN